jgi:hypothetical protein
MMVHDKRVIAPALRGGPLVRKSHNRIQWANEARRRRHVYAVVENESAI